MNLIDALESVPKLIHSNPNRQTRPPGRTRTHRTSGLLPVLRHAGPECQQAVDQEGTLNRGVSRSRPVRHQHWQQRQRRRCRQRWSCWTAQTRPWSTPSWTEVRHEAWLIFCETKIVSECGIIQKLILALKRSGSRHTVLSW